MWINQSTYFSDPPSPLGLRHVNTDTDINVKMAHWDRTHGCGCHRWFLSGVLEDSVTISSDKDIPGLGNASTVRKSAESTDTGLGDIRLGYKCSLSPLSAGLPTASCCSHLFSCIATPLLSPTCFSIPFPCLHLLTSCPKHMGMRNQLGWWGGGEHVAVP